MPISNALPAGLGASDAARYVGMSPKTWRELRDRGVAPAGASPTGSARHRLWSPRELEAWVAAGCPEQREWRPMWRAMLLSGAWRGATVEANGSRPGPVLEVLKGGLKHVG